MKKGNILKLLALMADELIVAVLLLIVLPAMGINVPTRGVLVILGVLLIKDIVIVPFLLNTFDRKVEVGVEVLIGRPAVVVEDLTSEGLVKLEGELWKAECINGTARRGEEVKVVAVEGTKVLVECPE
ncbi:NfeD family protein [Thermococcus sp. GR7]|uniref:NfeD family protein n=1 Tax=unclassified Thermococcus TaxID=2627626 RepID=UPI00142F5F45|nr:MULTISPECIES: NfeD family protein [unclassified Thermococcus]NJE46934.1 NfeD family protein [Thermococcus sp. GR7]NJE78431.1 NfeD family protein [Thermococcus sp. GR4]NJF23272.1 NfeD family protein [Thermococcus sp. GR5]